MSWVAGALALASMLAPSAAPGSALGGGGGGVSPATDDTLQLQHVREIVARGHAWLIRQQNRDGSFSIERSEANLSSAPVAVTALAALSLMAAGNLPDRGPHERSVRAAIEWLVDHCSESGYFTTDGDSVSKMHGHGYALLALTQACGMYGEDPSRRKQMRDAIQRGVHLIEVCQGDSGGWFYDDRKVTEHEGSVTVCMIQALRAARDAGFAVDAGTIERAVRYMRASQDSKSGRFRYRINDPKTSWALTAAALATLNATGDYGSELVTHGFVAMQESDPFSNGWNNEQFQDYGALYAAQAYWQHPDRAVFDRWWPDFVTRCDEDQQPDGDFPNGDYGNVYATAIVTLTLQVPVGYLPLFQR